jgi:hypothetical protein
MSRLTKYKYGGARWCLGLKGSLGSPATSKCRNNIHRKICHIVERLMPMVTPALEVSSVRDVAAKLAIKVVLLDRDSSVS